jgi:putative transposase
MFVCRYCKKASAYKRGVKKNKSGWIPRYFCSSCQRSYVQREGFERCRHNAEVISAALDLRAKGLSLADVVDHLDQHHRVKISRKTVLDWVKKFGSKMKSFTQTLIPLIDGDIHADEVFLKAGGKWNYFWDALDYVTKFLVGDHLSTERCEQEATIFLQGIKDNVGGKIWRIHTDNSYDYPDPIQKVFGKKVFHQHFPAWKMKFKNNPIERFHNTLKERYKTMRGFDNTTSARAYLEFWKIYYNFIRKHTTLKGKTPAQAAKIELKLKRNRIRSLIELLLTFQNIRITHN